MSRPVDRTVLASWSQAESCVALAKAVCLEVTRSFGLHQCCVELHERDGRPFFVIDNLVMNDVHRLAYVNGDLWRLDPLVAALHEHRGPAGDEVIDPATLMELARRNGYTGDDVHTLLLPLVESDALIGAIRCGRLEPFSELHRRDLLVVSTHVSVCLARLGVTTATDANPALSPRQHDVAQLAARGLSNLEIADVLAISENTVKKRLKEVFVRLDVSNRTEMSLVLRRPAIANGDAPLGVSRDGALTITRGTPR